MLLSTGVGLFAAFLSSCHGGMKNLDESSGLDQSFEHFHCLSPSNVHTENYRKFSLSLGWEIENNVWGAYLLGGESWYQCLLRYQDGSWGWNWSFPFKPWYMLAYPMLRIHDIGQSEAFFPRDVNSPGNLKLKVHYDWYQLSSDFRGNMAPELWIVNTNAINSNNFFDFSLRVGEIMFWLDVKGGLTTGATEVATYTSSNGVNWKLFVNTNHQSHNLDNGWVYMAFVAQQAQRNTEIPMSEMVSFALSKVRELPGHSSYCSSNCYLLDLELGTEVMSGSGRLKLHEWSWTH